MTRAPALPREPRNTRRGLPPFSVLFGDLKNELTRLVRGELALLKAELSEKLAQLGIGIGMFVGAALFGFFALAVLVTTAVLAFALIVPAWLAALIVAVILLLIAGILALIGVRSLKSALPPVPTETIASIREDVNAVRGRGE